MSEVVRRAIPLVAGLALGLIACLLWSILDLPTLAPSLVVVVVLFAAMVTLAAEKGWRMRRKGDA